MRKGGFGYLPQDPRIDQALEDRTAVTHVLSGRGIDDELVRIEKLRLAMEETPTERNVARYSRAEENFQVNGGYAAESEARALAAGLGLDETRMELPIGVLSGGERRRVELARILFAGSDVLCLDEPTNHLDVDAKLWLMGFLRQYRGALLVISHDLDLLDEAITRVLHLDRPTETAVGTIVEYRGTYSQYIAARAEDERRLAKLAAQQGKEIARLQRVRRPLRRQGHQSGDGAQHREAHRSHGGRSRARPEAHPGDRRALPRSAGVRADRAGRRAPVQGIRRPTGVRGRRRSTSVAASACSCSASTAPARRACSGSSPARAEADLGQFDYGHNVDARLLRPGARQPRPGRFGARQPPRRRAAGLDLTETELRGLLGHDGPVGREGLPGRRAPCRAARRPSWRWRC